MVKKGVNLQMTDYKTRMIEQRKENIKRIKDQVNLMDLAQEMGFNVLRHGSYFKLAEHNSCVIYPQTNTYKHYSTAEKAKDVIDFLIEFCDMNFNQAYKYLLPRIDASKTYETKAELQQKKAKMSKQQRTRSLLEQLNFMLDDNCKNSIAYLIKTRGIDPSIVFEMVKKNMIKQHVSKEGAKSVVFLGYDENGMLSAGDYRACSSQSSFRGTFKNCDYNFGWLYDPEIDPSSFCPKYNWNKPLIITEANIDKLALMSMMHDKQIDPVKYNFSKELTKTLEDHNYDYKSFLWLSISSVSNIETAYSLQQKFGIKEVIIATDNDKYGERAANFMKQEFTNRGCITHRMYSMSKDWDQDRINILDKSLAKRLAVGNQKLNQHASKSDKPEKTVEKQQVL